MELSPTRPLSRRITDLLKELHIIDHPGSQQIDQVESLQSSDRRQEIRRELVRIVNLLGWRQAFPLRLWMYGRASKRIQ
jgi:hypothetical protein